MFVLRDILQQAQKDGRAVGHFKQVVTSRLKLFNGIQ
jgi:hypothetical protein